MATILSGQGVMPSWSQISKITENLEKEVSALVAQAWREGYAAGVASKERELNEVHL